MAFLNLKRVGQYTQKNVQKVVVVFNGLVTKFDNKFEGTVLGRAKTFLKNLATDYKEVFVETADNMKNNPRKAAAYAGAAGTVLWCNAMNPDSTSFRTEVVTWQQKMMMIPTQIRNPESVSNLRDIENCYNEGRIRVYSLGVLSLVWMDDTDPQTGLYESQCKYLKPTLASYPYRILDVGFLGRWWFINRWMSDYDVNPNEFPC